MTPEQRLSTDPAAENRRLRRQFAETSTQRDNLVVANAELRRQLLHARGGPLGAVLVVAAAWFVGWLLFRAGAR